AADGWLQELTGAAQATREPSGPVRARPGPPRPRRPPAHGVRPDAGPRGRQDGGRLLSCQDGPAGKPTPPSEGEAAGEPARPAVVGQPPLTRHAKGGLGNHRPYRGGGGGGLSGRWGVAARGADMVTRTPRPPWWLRQK